MIWTDAESLCTIDQDLLNVTESPMSSYRPRDVPQGFHVLMLCAKVDFGWAGLEGRGSSERALSSPFAPIWRTSGALVTRNHE
jgi:hypothetical protein